MRAVIVLILVVGLGGCAARIRTASTTNGAQNVLAAWREPTADESNQDWRSDDAKRYLFAQGDFNGDGVTDEARIFVKADGNGMALFVLVSKNGTFVPILLDESDDASWLDVMGVSLAPAGRYRTACGKGYFDCAPGESEEIDLQRPAINYFTEEGANSFFHWDATTGAFRRTWMSD